LALSVLHTFFSSTPFAERIITDLEHLVQASVMAKLALRMALSVVISGRELCKYGRNKISRALW
jgi:hypothetical protein